MVSTANSKMGAILEWVRANTETFPHVDVKNFTTSWQNGMAFAALVCNWR